MIFKYIKVCLLLVFISSHIIGQNTGDIPNDLSRVKIDNLSDEQFNQILKRVEESGMTESQVKVALMTRGLPPAELRKLEERLNSGENRNNDSKTIENSRFRTFDERQMNYFDSLSFLVEDTLIFEESGPESRIFGYDLFRNRILTFEPGFNMPTPVDYQVGPGDELIVDIWGASQHKYYLMVSPEGNIFIDNLGPIQVSGLTLEKANEIITNRLTRIYSGLAGPNQNTYAQMTLGITRSLRIHVLGEVSFPGTYTLSAFSTIFNALYASGGPSFNGSFRDVDLIRNNRRIATLDIYEFLMYGKQDNNIRLQDQDVIKVHPYKTRIDITGEVKRPGLYEMKEGETFSDLINYSGGYTDKAFRKLLTVYRKTDTERKLLNLTSEATSFFTLQDGDSIPVAPILQRFENMITVQGAVFRPGNYALEENMTLTDLINRAEGLREDAFLSRALIYRTRDDFTVEIIPVNLKNVNNDRTAGILLKKNDIISVSSIFDLREEYFFEIKGAVNQNGVFPYVEGATLEDLIFMAGGLKESASLSRVEIARRYKFEEDENNEGLISEIFYFDIERNLEISEEGERFILEPFDQVFVRISPGYEEPQLISVEGEVLYPGNYSLATKKERISDIVLRSGGLTVEAYPEGASLIRKLDSNQERRRSALASLMEESDDSYEFNIDEEAEQAIGIDLKRIMNDPGGKYDIYVQQQDRLIIPKELQTVRLSGALLHPISVKYDKSYNFSRYVSMSGGFATDAKRSKSYVIYANGSIDKTTNLLFFNLYPKVEPGAEIIVPRKPTRERVSTQEVIGISSALTSMALIISTIINSFGGGGGN